MPRLNSLSRAPLPLRPQRGFTLLEVVVAVAVLGIFLGAGLELLALGLRSARTSTDITQAVLLARQKLDELSIELKPGVIQGKGDGAYRWAAEIVPETVAPRTAEAEEEDVPARLFRVKVKVAWPTGRTEKSIELTTLRVAFDEDKLPGVVGGAGSAATPGAADRASGQRVKESGQRGRDKERTGAKGRMR